MRMRINIDVGLLILRIGAAGLLLTHGIPKLLGYSSMYTMFPDPLGVTPGISLALTVFAEVFCSLAVLLGFKTQWAAIPPAIVMLVAITIIHAHDPWAKQEFALLYFICFLTLIFTGGGAFSIDRVRGRN